MTTHDTGWRRYDQLTEEQLRQVDAMFCFDNTLTFRAERAYWVERGAVVCRRLLAHVKDWDATTLY